MENSNVVVDLKAVKKVPHVIDFKFVDPIAAAHNARIEIPMLIKGLKRGTVGVLAGQGGIGKSTLILGLAYGLAHPDLDVFGMSESKEIRRVMILSAEDDADIVSNKMKDFDTLHKLDGRKRQLAKDSVFITADRDLMKKISDPEWMANLKKTLEELKIDLIVFDTYSVFGGVENENDNAEAAAIINVINKDLIASTQLSVLLIHHTNNEGNIRGAKALKDNTRVTYIVRKPTEDEAENLEAAGLDPTDYANFGIIKSNYARSGSLCWLKMSATGIFMLADEDAVEAINKKDDEKSSGSKKSKKGRSHGEKF